MKKSELRKIIKEVISEQAGASLCFGMGLQQYEQFGGYSGGIDYTPTGPDGIQNTGDEDQHIGFSNLGFLTWPEMCPYTGGAVTFMGQPDDWPATEMSAVGAANWFANIMEKNDGSNTCACYEENYGTTSSQTIGKPDAIKDPGNKYPGKGKPMMGLDKRKPIKRKRR